MAWNIFDKALGEHPTDVGRFDTMIEALKRIEDGIDLDEDSLTNYEIDSSEQSVTLGFKPRHDGVMSHYVTMRPLTRAVPVSGTE